MGISTVRTLRRLGLQSLVTNVETVLAHPIIDETLGDAWRQRVRRPGRRGREDAEYLDWARRYVEALERAPRSPVAAMIAEDGDRGEHRTPNQVRHYIKQARDRGLLKPKRPPAGVAAGELTKKARRMLTELQGG